MHQVVRAYTCFTCLTFIDWSAFVGLCLVVGAVLFALLLLSFCPLTTVRSSYQPMTSLTYLHDCHSCYDERSIVQKKNLVGRRWDAESRSYNQIARKPGGGGATARFCWKARSDVEGRSR